jgi:hypothetical protein
VRAAAAYALGEQADERAVQPLLARLSLESWKAKSAIFTALASFPQHPQAQATVKAHQQWLNNFPYAHRHFIYQVSPAELKDYLHQSGYETEELFNREGTQTLGFKVSKTTLVVGYPIWLQGREVAKGGVTLRNTPDATQGKLEMAEQSLKLFHKLYRRFRFCKPKSVVTN